MSCPTPPIRFLFALALSLCALGPPALGQSHLHEKKDGAVGYNEDRVTDLPTGENKLFTTLTLSDGYAGDPRQVQILQWMKTDPRLVRLVAQTHYNQYTTSNPHFKERLRHSFGEAVPILSIQLPDGKVLMNVTAKSMPRTSGELADMVDNALAERFAPPTYQSDGNEPLIVEDCPDDSCQPWRPEPTVPVVGPVVPEVIPVGPILKNVSGLVWLVLVGLGLLGGGGVLLIVGSVVVYWLFSGTAGENQGGGRIFNS